MDIDLGQYIYDCIDTVLPVKTSGADTPKKQKELVDEDSWTSPEFADPGEGANIQTPTPTQEIFTVPIPAPPPPSYESVMPGSTMNARIYNARIYNARIYNARICNARICNARICNARICNTNTQIPINFTQSTSSKFDVSFHNTKYVQL
jgi:hypothetical protein